VRAIIPAAGLGTRLLPTTKAVPKELLAVEGEPAIQWVLKEAVGAGLREFIVVISPYKAILRDYLTILEENHPLAGHPGLAELEQLLRTLDITFVEQPYPKGLGDALLRCRDLIREDPFVLLLPDNICPKESHLIEQLLDVYHTYKKSCLALRRVDGPALRDGAIIAQPLRNPVFSIQRVLPKGTSEGQEVGLRGIGRYVLEPATFSYLEQARTEGELDDVPALDGLARSGQLLGLLVTDRVYHMGVADDRRGHHGYARGLE
jgi:UTP--glucose-1-phosphate uridylyltransferase